MKATVLFLIKYISKYCKFSIGQFFVGALDLQAPGFIYSSMMVTVAQYSWCLD